VTYGQTLDKVRRIAAWLLRNGASAEHPVCVLSDNSVAHGLLMFACMHVGIPYAAISPAYSLVSRDHAKLKNLIERLDPGFIYTEGAARFAPAMEAVQSLHKALWVVGDADEAPQGAIHFS